MMRNKDYFSEMGIDPSQLENSLDAVSDRVFTFSRYGCDGVSYRFKSRKVKYRVVAQHKRSQMQLGYLGGRRYEARQADCGRFSGRQHRFG